jgi:hypothetical protein
MPTYLLVELADDGTATATALTDPVNIEVGSVPVPLASLFPPAPAQPGTTPADAPTA